MNTSKSFEALRRANPRTNAGFPQSVESAAEAVRAQVVSTPTDRALAAGTAGHRRRRFAPSPPSPQRSGLQAPPPCF